MITMTEKRFFEWHEDNVAVTLRSKSGSYGGGSEVLIINSSGDDIAGTFDASHYKGQDEREGAEREYIVVSELERRTDNRHSDITKCRGAAENA